MRRLLRTAALSAIVVLAAGCGGSAGGESVPATVTDGKQIFTDAGCAACHTLAAAGAHGGGGPNLDNLKPGVDAAVQRIGHGGGGMPSFKDKLSAEQIETVAKYIASVAGK